MPAFNALMERLHIQETMEILPILFVQTIYSIQFNSIHHGYSTYSILLYRTSPLRPLSTMNVTELTVP